MKNTTLTLPIEDAEPILRKAAYEAARFGGFLDYIGRKTYLPRGMPGPHGDGYDASRQIWQARFLKAKRMVEAFGVEYEQTTEPEALGTTYPYWKNEKVRRRHVPGIGMMIHREGGEPDMKRPVTTYQGNIHDDACEAAAERVVRRWRSQFMI